MMQLQRRNLLSNYSKKHLRSLEIAKENNLACIYLVDSGGANLQEQTEYLQTRIVLEEYSMKWQ